MIGMKRIVSFILCLAMVMTLFGQISFTAFADGEPTITCTCDKTEYKPGDKVTIEVTLSNNPGINMIQLKPAYSQGLGDQTINLKSGSSSTAGVLEVINGEIFSKLATGKNLIWDDGGVEDVTDNGELATVKLTIGEEVEAGSYSVGFKLIMASKADEDLVEFTMVPATVCVKTVPVAVTGVSLDATATVKTGSTVTLTPSFTPAKATNKNVTWTTSDSTVATVSGGVVSGIKAGSATITVTTEDGSFTDTCAVTVECGHTNTHSYEAESSTCQAQGHAAYTVCDDCGVITAGDNAALPLDEHTYVETASEEYLVSAATCHQKAVYYKSCSVCGEKSSETFEYGEFDASNHEGGTYKKDQKEATCYEEGYTGDTYCSGCNQKISSGTSIGKNEHNPASTWSTDATHHWHACQTVGCGNLIDKAAHSGGTAACKSKAVCEVCGAEYGEFDAGNHVHTEIRGAKEATCCEAGYTGDTYCTDCDEKIANGEEIPATGKHVDADGKWETDGTQHWHTCYNGVKFDITNHSGGTAACKSKAVCEVCGAEYGELDAGNHVHTEIRDAKEATCCEAGYTGDTYCTDCGEKIANGEEIPATGKHVDADGKWETDGTQHWHTCYYGTKFDITNHSGGTATCKSKAVCEVCGVEYGDLNAENHVHTETRDAKAATCSESGYTGDTYCKDCGKKLADGEKISATGIHTDADGLWEYDGTQHYHTCACGAIFDIAAHSGGTATCKNQAVCTACGAKYGELNAENHTGGTEIKNQKQATCSEEGYTGDTCCKSCGEKLASGESIEKISHNITEWKVTKEATTSECGEKTGKCTLCGEEFQSITAKLISKPIEEKATEYKGMQSVPKLVPDKETFLPEDIVFVAERKDAVELESEEKTEAERAIEEVKSNVSAYVEEEGEVEKADVLCKLYP